MQIFMIVTSQKGVIDMRAGFIGAGKVGFSLGKYLKENGVEITGYFSKSPESAKSAADFTNTKLYKSIEYILRILKIKIFVIAAVRFHQPFFLMVKTSVQISIRYIPYMQ